MDVVVKRPKMLTLKNQQLHKNLSSGTNYRCA